MPPLFYLSISDGGSVTLTVTFNNWDPTPDDFVTISCGPTLSLDDYLDAVTLVDIAAESPVKVTFSNLVWAELNIALEIKRTDLLVSNIDVTCAMFHVVTFASLSLFFTFNPIPVTCSHLNQVYMRCDYKFVYVGVTFYPNINNTAIGFLSVPSVDSPTAPKQGHLSYTNDPTSMVLQYVSGSNNTRPSVRLGKSASSFIVHFYGTSTTYHNSDLCHAPANQTAQQWFRDPGFLHTIKMTNLAPNMLYFYQYGNDVQGWSSVYSFRSAPATPRNVRFVAYGDQDLSDGARNTSRYVSYEATQRDLDFVVHFGDLGYSLGNSWRWDAWGTLIADGASRVPYMVSIGNHGV